MPHIIYIFKAMMTLGTKIWMMAIASLMLLACSEKPVSPYTPYIIEGEVTGVRDSIEISLYQYDGNVGSRIASDTIVGGKFHFEQVMQDPEINKLSLIVADDDFPLLSRTIYVKPGAQVKVKGSGNHIMTWNVESKVPEQMAYDELQAIPEYEPYQDIALLRTKVIDELYRIDRKTEKERFAEVYSRYKAINEQDDSIMNIITAKQIVIMKHTKPSEPWLNELFGFARMSNAYPDYAYAEDAKALYQSLPEEMKQTKQGLEIYANLYPPKQAMNGDDFPDADFYDLDGNLHHIADYKGKYILLDFWSSGCGPCIKAFPEMKEVYEKYGDKLAIISMSVDTESRWRKASEKHDITWSNWNEMKGEGGLYTNYRIRGIPYYVLINPEGKIEKQIKGYSEDSFKTMFSELFDK